MPYQHRGYENFCCSVHKDDARVTQNEDRQRKILSVELLDT